MSKLEYTLKKEIPIQFIENLHEHFGASTAKKTLSSLQENSSVSIRVNPLKRTNKYDDEKAVPWSDHGFILNERPSFSLDPLFHAGCYYVQDSSSMIIEKILNKIKPERNGLYLDMCAAPGGKSTILLDYLDEDGFLIANEVDPKRNSILRENILKWGRLNVGVTSLPASKFDILNCAFDLILIDAPCSGEGMFRKDAHAIEQWSSKLVKSCALTQRNILTELTPTLKEGGILIYSTCTTNKNENEFQVQALIESGEFEPVEIDLSEFSEYLVKAQTENQIIGHYLLPGISTGEGLFVSVLRKTSTSANENIRNRKFKTPFDQAHLEFKQAFPNINDNLVYWNLKDEMYAVRNHNLIEHFNLPFKMVGLPYYQMKGKNVIPLHGMAMSNIKMEHIELDEENSLQFLRKETISLPRNLKKGWTIVGFQNNPLGWLKIIDQRSNNYYPSWLRLRT